MVHDSGIGISALALPHVFDALVQDPQAVSFNGLGLGLGLAVVHEIIQAHGGTVQALSAGHGLGSRFEITLTAL